MKTSLALPGLFSLFFSLCAQAAVSWDIVGPCTSQPVRSGSASLSAPGESVGRFTKSVLDQGKIPYQGSEAGFSSMMGTPTGDASLEVLSNTQMRAYGWCFEINGKVSDKMPDQAPLTGTEHLTWVYAFSEYNSGKWVSFCVPAYTVKPKKLCN